MENKASKTSSATVSKIRRQFGTFFNSLSFELKASSRRMQLYGEILLNTMIESGIYSNDPLCSKSGIVALKNALKFYNIGITSLTDSSDGITDLDGMSDGYKSHVAFGLQIFDKIVDLNKLDNKDKFYFQVLRDVLAFHHERWDGTGYPNGIMASEIPLAARVCAVCNEFETLTTSSAERDKMTTEAAAEEITRRTATYFDPDVVEAINKSADKINEVLENGAVAKATTGSNSVRAIEQLYRSVYDYGNHMPYGFDCDVRLNDAELGVISSKVFVPIAEKSSKINELVKWNVEEVCNTITYLKRRNRFTGVFFIPMSVKSLLKKNFINNISRIVEKFDVETAEICFVISENIFSFNTERVADALMELHGLGYKVAIGGFGSESINLSVLQRLEVDYIFLNPNFVADVLTSVRAKKVVASVIELSNRLDIIVVADGVVNKQQAEELYIMGCNIMCGPYYGRYTAVTVI